MYIFMGEKINSDHYVPGVKHSLD